ncbi:MAG TPA: Fur family transcriptional regulator [Leptolinea sp.]
MKTRNPIVDEWIKLLRKSGYRQTDARKTIVEVILETNHALEPLEIFEIGRKKQAKLGLVTVYRTLERLEELGLVQRVHQPGGCNMYLQAAREHQHLLICTKCGKADFFSGDDLTPLMINIAARSGYKITEHWLQLFGQCADCQKN